MNLEATLWITLCEVLVIGASLWLLAVCNRQRLWHDLPSLTITLTLAGTALILLSLAYDLYLNVSGLSASSSPEERRYLWLGLCVGIACMLSSVPSLFQQGVEILSPHKPQRHTAPDDSELKNENTQLRSTLERSEKRFNVLFHANPAPLLVVDAGQSILSVNSACASLLRTKADVMKNQQLEAFVIEEDRALIKNLASEKIRKKKPGFNLDLRFVPEENEPLWIRVSPSNIQLDGGAAATLFLLQDISEAKNLAEIIAFHSQYDELTMLNNREGLENFLTAEFDRYASPPNNIALLYLDIDQLKVVNDTCGHSAGDQLLQHLVSVIADASKDCHFFARLGGDEFALVKRNSNEEQAQQIAEKIRSAVEDFTFVWQQNNYRQSVSIGVALSSNSVNNVVDLVGAADSACHAAKERGKNRVIVYSEDLSSGLTNRRDMQWVSRLQKAIQNSSFELYFQPIGKLADQGGDYVHYEFLIRYVDEDGQHISPNHFLPAAERFGFSEQIDLWVLTTALDFLDKHPKHTEILNCCSINLTTQSIANPRSRSAILQVVESYNFPREKICFEITESSAIQNLSEAKDFVTELKTLGCHFALDDFGTGFSSFGYLKHLAVDYLKIDGSFVRDIKSDKFDRAMVSAINNIGKEMDIAIIAEYAENSEVLQILEDMEVDYAQGYAIARPMPLYKLESYFE